MNRLVAASLLFAAALPAAALAAGPALPKSGSVHHAAYTVCRALGGVDLGEVGSDASAECTGIVRTKDASPALDNLAIKCLEGSTARQSGYKFTGTCVETDADGDKIYLVYEGPEIGPIEALGGSGKYKGLTGKGQWSVSDAPGNTASLFAFTLDYTLDWKTE
jgi:hypothetical protein